jgi:hypothetical protein
MGHTSDYVATEPWMYGKEDPCAGPGWRERTARKGQNPTPQASQKGLSERRGPRAMLHGMQAWLTMRGHLNLDTNHRGQTRKNYDNNHHVQPG